MNDTFERLKAIMLPVTDSLDVVADKPGHFDVCTSHMMKNRKPLWFGAVRIMKNYVSYHLMPVYANPELLADLSDPLRKRMQGKSCFNFKVIDEELFEELETLTRRGYDDYAAKGYVDARS
ncbi:MAG: hypothetical protein AAFY88_01975 [Acidobacteriota bacterium]